MSTVQCGFCKTVGKNGARYLVQTASGEPVPVHKPCGEKLVAAAPAAAKARLVPSPELRAEWRQQKEERTAQQFWAEKCPDLVKLRQKLASSSAPANPATS